MAVTSVVDGLYTTASASSAGTWGTLFSSTLNNATPKLLLANGEGFIIDAWVISANTTDSARRLRTSIAGSPAPSIEFMCYGNAMNHQLTVKVVRISDTSILISTRVETSAGDIEMYYTTVTGLASLTSNTVAFLIEGKCGTANADSVTITAANVLFLDRV